MFKSPSQLLPGDRINYISGKVAGFTTGRANLPMTSTVAETTPYRCDIHIKLTNGSTIIYPRGVLVRMADCDDQSGYKVQTRDRPDCVNGVSIN